MKSHSLTAAFAPAIFLQDCQLDSSVAAHTEIVRRNLLVRLHSCAAAREQGCARIHRQHERAVHVTWHLMSGLPHISTANWVKRGCSHSQLANGPLPKTESRQRSRRVRAATISSRMRSLSSSQNHLPHVNMAPPSDKDAQSAAQMPQPPLPRLKEHQEQQVEEPQNPPLGEPTREVTSPRALLTPTDPPTRAPSKEFHTKRSLLPRPVPPRRRPLRERPPTGSEAAPASANSSSSNRDNRKQARPLPPPTQHGQHVPLSRMPARGNSQVARPSRIPRLVSPALPPPQRFSRQLPTSVRLSRRAPQDKPPFTLLDVPMALPQDEKSSTTLENESMFSEPSLKGSVSAGKTPLLATSMTSKQHASTYGNDDAEMMKEKHTAAVDDGTDKKKTSPEPSIDEFWDAEFASTMEALDSWGRTSERFQTNIAKWEKEVDDEIKKTKKLTSDLEPGWERKERNMRRFRQHYEEALSEARKRGTQDQHESSTEDEFLLGILENEIKKRQLDAFSGGNQEFGDEIQEEMNRTEHPYATSIPESRSRTAGTGIPDSRSPSLTEAGTFGSPTTVRSGSQKPENATSQGNVGGEE